MVAVDDDVRLSIFEAASDALGSHLLMCPMCGAGRACPKGDRLAEAEFRAYHSLPRDVRDRVRLWGLR